MANARKVQVIEATINPKTHLSTTSPRKRRVAAYARVSTDSEEQLESFKSQKSHYESLILENSDMQLVDIYADEAISGTQTYKRDEFNRMILDAFDGKIDIIVVKNISRFARNTIDTLQYVRQLKEKNIEVWFEEENIRTLLLFSTLKEASFFTLNGAISA